ncbi:MAG: hypothetical protein Ta2B_04900 [Termitinemataceae bacterium]|nr:MAG: hypothetical protein Ta2B_04900 [Termitinemataceae bacterium]
MEDMDTATLKKSDLSNNIGVSLRTVALFAILYQIRLATGDLCDTSVFVTTLLSSFLSAYTLQKTKVKAIESVVIILLVPILVRFFISIPRYFFDDSNLSMIIQSDSLLLNFDRNNWITLLPFYFTAITTYFAIGFRKACRFSVLSDCILLLVLFTITQSATIEIYKFPVVKISVFSAILLLELMAAMFSAPPQLKTMRTEYVAAISMLVLLCVILGVLLVKPMQESALEANGGLIRPKMFSFDFAPFLKLEDQVAVTDDLIFIVRKDSSALDPYLGMNENNLEETLSMHDYHYLMRRYVLSSYNSGTEKDKTVGFYRNDVLDEESQSYVLPRGTKEYTVNGQAARSELDQEYYLVNIDAAAFIAMNDQSKVVPFETWDTSSFKSAYSVKSLSSYVFPAELYGSVKFFDPQTVGESETAKSLDLSLEQYRIYTDFGAVNKKTDREKKITELAHQLTVNKNNYAQKIETLYSYLKYGQYRYSLKPGIAKDGDQLSYFLFDSKKGYCSYFAFAYAAMLRSIGIPCRVAVGFYMDLKEERLGFFPIRSKMAHAWVEIWYPQYGWIEYDPTTETMAVGEEEEDAGDVMPDAFEKLLKEILDNHNKLSPKEAEEELEAHGAGKIKKTISSIKNWMPLIFTFLIIIILFYIRYNYFIKSLLVKNKRKKTILLWKSILRTLYFCGHKKNNLIPEKEWVDSLGEQLQGICEEGDAILCKQTPQLENITLFSSMYDYVVRAKFAEHYSDDDMNNFMQKYKHFKKWYKKSRKSFEHKVPIVFILFIALANIQSSADEKDKTNDSETLSMSGDYNYTQSDADRLYYSAREAALDEYWERAIKYYFEGKKLYPGDERFPLDLGDLYFDRELYTLALEEYLICNKLNPLNSFYLLKLAFTEGSLNNYKASANYYEKVLKITPDYEDAINGLAWVYYKLHRLKDSETLLLDAIKAYGETSKFCMTLATVYSEMFEYEKSKYYYLESIESEKRNKEYGINSLAALAYYNLSILESNYYNFADAYQTTVNSLKMLDKSSGHLARGELNLRRHAFKDTFKDYEESYEHDKSPLTKLSMALAFLHTGSLHLSLAYSLDCLNQKNMSWMINYGIDPDTYKCELYDIIYKSYDGLYEAEKFFVSPNAKEWFFHVLRKVEFAFKAKANKLLQQKYSLLAANSIYAQTQQNNFQAETIYSNDTENQVLQALKYYYFAFNDYNKRALYYLEASKEIEVNLIPRALPSYMFEEGKLLGVKGLLDDAIDMFDPIWEQDMISETYSELGVLAKKRWQTSYLTEITNKLFAMNPGALRQNGLSLNVSAEIRCIDRSLQKKIAAALNKSGFITKIEQRNSSKQTSIEALGSLSKSNPSQANGSSNKNNKTDLRFKLFVIVNNLEVQFQIFDTVKGTFSTNKTYMLKGTNKKDVAEFVNKVAYEAFTAE